jgi:nucleoside-diphosphate-sugar epimerase
MHIMIVGAAGILGRKLCERLAGKVSYKERGLRH